MSKGVCVSLKLKGLNFILEQQDVIAGVYGVCPSIVILPYGVRGIKKNAFSGIAELEVFGVNKDIEFVESKAFANCPNLKEIRIYEGQEWLIPSLTKYNDAKIVILKE